MQTNDLYTTPLNAWHRSNGAQMLDFGGWDMPLHYASGIIREHLATRRHGGIFDVSHMGRFRVKGRDRMAFLQHVLSNNAQALRPWQAQYTLIPRDDGGVIDDAYLYRFGEDDYLLVVNAGNRVQDWAHFQDVAASFKDVILEEHTESLAMIALQGPDSGQMLEGLLEGGALPEPFRNMLSELVLCNAPILIGRTGYTGEPVGFEMFVPADRVEAVWSRLVEVGADKGFLPAGLGARDTLRLEAGLPLHGHEFGVDLEGKEIPAYGCPLAGIAVSFSELKGEFIGREALAAQFEQVGKIRSGTYEPTDVLRRRVVPLALLDQGVIRRGHEVFVQDRLVGHVTSGTVAPFWIFEGQNVTMRMTEAHGRRSIALAYLDADLPMEQEVSVAVRLRRLKAQIVPWHGRSEAPPYFRSIPVGWEKPKAATLPSQGLAKAELLLDRSLENHRWRQDCCVNLIPSEMTPSPLVRLLQVSDPVGRYAEHKEMVAFLDQEVFYYQGTELVSWVEERLAAEMAQYLGCPLIDTRPISGQMANMTVFSGFVDFKNRLDRKREPRRIRLAMNHHLARGGHLSSQPMGALRDYIRKDPVTERFAVVNFPVQKTNPYRIDLEATAKLLEEYDPEIVILGKSMTLHPEPIAEITKIVDTLGQNPILMYDMAHVLGLVGDHFQQPFKEGADIVTGSTHKTFFGTQRGIVGARFEENTPEYELWQAIERRAFPGMVSNHHLGTLLGLLLAAIEMNTFKDDYQRQIIVNAKAFARNLKARGLDVEGDPAVDYTETHQVIVNVGYARGCQVAAQLEKHNIIVNYQAIPSDEGFTASSGLRLGVSEMTRFGMKENDFETLAGLFAEAVRDRPGVGDEVAKFRRGFRKMHYCLHSDRLAATKQQLLETF